MKLLIVRHGDPDYAIDGLTEKGKREAELLRDRLCKEDIFDLCSSPLGRARLTAKPTADALGREVKILPFLEEFPPPVSLPYLSKPHCCWDFLPAFMEENPMLYHPTKWKETPIIQNSRVAEVYDWVCLEFDRYLEEHGYRRKGVSYEAIRPNHNTLVLVCHYGITAVLLSHLMHCSPYSLLQNCVTLPTSVTTVFTEEREEGIASFRCCAMGDLSHLYAAGEEPAFAARFCECFTDDTRHH